MKIPALFGLVSLLLLQQTAFAGCTVPSLPNELKLKEKVLTLVTSFKLNANGVTLGTINKKLFSLVTTFTYKDANERKIADASTKMFTWGTDIVVRDCEGHKIGEIKEEVLKSLFKVHTVYKILDAKGNQIASSEKLDWLGTEMTLFDQNHAAVAKLHRPWVNFLSDEWTVDILSPGKVDNRLLVMIGAFKTDADNERRNSKDK